MKSIISYILSITNTSCNIIALTNNCMIKVHKLIGYNSSCWKHYYMPPNSNTKSPISLIIKFQTQAFVFNFQRDRSKAMRTSIKCLSHPLKIIFTLKIKEIS